MSILVDATVLSNFAAIGRLDLLRLVLRSAFVAAAVQAEIDRGIDLGYPFLLDVAVELQGAAINAWLRVTSIEGDAERRAHDTLLRLVDDGEAMSIAIASVRRWMVYTDDADARRVAARMGVRIGGTLGLLRQLVVERELTMDQANALLREMIERARHRSPVKDLRDLR